jgi:hypothetical protein
MVKPPKNGSNTFEDALSALATAARGADFNAQPEHEREFDRLPFRAIDLIQHLEERLRGLRDETNPELRLPGLKVRHRVFVPGIEGEWIPAPDDNAVVARAIANPSLPLRHYLACEISSWGGEIYTTVYMHVSLQGRSLFLEFSTFALPPTRSEYHIFDEEGKTGLGFAVASILGALWRLPEAIGQIPRDLARAIRYMTTTLVGMSGRERAQERGLDIGAELSARELATDLQHQDWFQYRDVMKHWKIIERRMLATVLDFLHSRGVDVTEYRQRAIAVLNRGVINVGSGSVDVSGVIGDNSSVQVSGAAARE